MPNVRSSLPKPTPAQVRAAERRGRTLSGRADREATDVFDTDDRPRTVEEEAQMLMYRCIHCGLRIPGKRL